MKIRKISALLLGLILTCSLMFTACGNPSSKSTNEKNNKETAKEEKGTSDETIELEFYIWSDEENYISKVVEKYNAENNRNVKINLTTIPNDDYDDKMKVLLSGGANVDIIDIRGLSQVSMYVETGTLLDITDYVATSNLDISNYGPMWETSVQDGKTYSLPTRTTCWMLIYNKDIFDANGIEMPEQLTWTEYGELAKQLTSNDIYGGYWVPWIFQFAAIQRGVYLNSDDTSALRESIELLNQFYNIDKSHMSYAELSATNADYLAEFENGNAAMLPNGEWVINMLLQDAAAGKTDVNWEVAPMPIPDGVEPGTTWGQFQFAGINSATKYPEEAFDFLSYLCGPDGSAIYAEAGMIHAYSGEEAEEAYKQAVGKESVSVIFNAKKIQESPLDSNYDEISAAWNENVQLYLLGEKTIEETMDKFLSQRESIVKE
ncbi:MAG: sugar ABC transporter substrate-binding protein [Clostridiales bacterium]|nr:sugar ABC transporter substrate-binding protein [Clostridiales bacterium]